MNSKKTDTESKHLISSLPEALICHILSFLSTKDAASTSVLSKRWRFSLAFVPNLDFNTDLMCASFKAFVDRVMALQGNALLNKFFLKCEVCYDESFVDGWILNVLDRGVLDLDLYISGEFDYPLPTKVLMSSTLVRLKVGSKDEITIYVEEEVSLPKLKALYLCDNVSFDDESGSAFAKLISGCPVLEELVMINLIWGHWDFCSVCNPTLKRLIICTENIDENPKSVSFDTPSVVYLEIIDTVVIKYPKVNFDSLVEASLGFRMTPDQIFEARDSQNGYSSNDEEDPEDMVGNAADFLTGIRNVKILYLSSDTLEVLNLRCKAIPVFNNLIHLTIETHQDVGWDSLPNLLENCPNLETIIFRGLHYKDTKECWDERHRFKDTNKCWNEYEDKCVCKPWEGTPIWLSTSPVKTLKELEFGEISNYKDDMYKQVELIKYFVETMPNLEHVIVYWDTPFDDDLRLQSTELQMLEKVASAKCKIEIISDNISYSSTVHSSSSTSEPVFFKYRFPV